MMHKDLKGYSAYCYRKDNDWYCNGLLLDNPVVTVHHIGADPYTDEMYIVCLITAGNILGTGTIY